MIDLKELINQNFGQMVAWRRHFHEHPELSDHEFETMAFVEKQLENMGIPYQEIPKSGILAVVDSGKPGKTVLLRSDLDALPIEENPMNLTKKKIAVSSVKGVMHACGHDGHMSMLLCAAKVLNELKDQFSGKVVLMFERGEELTGNIRFFLPYLVEKSGLKIDAVYATHVRWDVPAGKMCIIDGPAMAGGFGFVVRLRGRGGHASRPDMARNPLDAFAGIYDECQKLRMKYTDPADVVTFAITCVSAGQKFNVVPDELTFSGNCRTLNTQKSGIPLHDKFREIVSSVSALNECTCEFLRDRDPIYEVRNNHDCVMIGRKAVKEQLGEGALCSAGPWMASETFSLMLQLYPGILAFTGIMDPEVGSGAPHHTDRFDLAEEGLKAGAVTAAAYALEILSGRHTIHFTSQIHEPMEKFYNRNL